MIYNSFQNLESIYDFKENMKKTRLRVILIQQNNNNQQLSCLEAINIYL
jgi:hypothetical protein